MLSIYSIVVLIHKATTTPPFKNKLKRFPIIGNPFGPSVRPIFSIYCTIRIYMVVGVTLKKISYMILYKPSFDKCYIFTEFRIPKNGSYSDFCSLCRKIHENFCGST